MHGDSHVSTKWCFLTTPNRIEFRRIESIRGEGERGRRNSKCRHEGLDRSAGEPRTREVVGDIAGNLVSSLSKRVKKREGRKKKRNRRGYSWDPSDSPISTGSLRSEGEGRNTLDAKMCKLQGAIRRAVGVWRELREGSMNDPRRSGGEGRAKGN